jgi:hypothetical protein
MRSCGVSCVVCVPPNASCAPVWPTPPTPPPVVFPLMYVATIMPFQIFFIYSTTSEGWMVMEYVLTVVFLLDVIACFNFAYVAPSSAR